MAEESKYAYDEESVKAIIEWAQTTQLPKEVMLSEAERTTTNCNLLAILDFQHTTNLYFGY